MARFGSRKKFLFTFYLGGGKLNSTRREGDGRRKIRELFEGRPGEWIPLPTILRLGVAQYNARILELRREGYRIENETQWIEGVRTSRFRFMGKREAQ